MEVRKPCVSCMDTAHVRETPPPKKQPYKGSVTSIFWYLNLFGDLGKFSNSGIRDPPFSTLSPLGWIIQIPPFHLPVTSGHPNHAQRTTCADIDSSPRQASSAIAPRDHSSRGSQSNYDSFR